MATVASDQEEKQKCWQEEEVWAPGGLKRADLE